MKFSALFTSALLTGSSAFAPRIASSQRKSMRTLNPEKFKTPVHGYKKASPPALHSSEDADMDYNFENKPLSNKQLAFIDIMNDDMESLKGRLKKGLDPDTKYFSDNTILHLIAFKGAHKSLDDTKYLALLKQLKVSGADLMAKNDSGNTAVEFALLSKNLKFAQSIKLANKEQLEAPFKQTSLDAQLATFASQAQPNPSKIGKKRIINLVMKGANVNYSMENGKTIFENIKQNWSTNDARQFAELVDAARLKSTANGKIKETNNVYANSKWVNAVMEFHKPSDYKGRGL